MNKLRDQTKCEERKRRSANEESIMPNGKVYLVTIKNNSIKYTDIASLHTLYMWLVKKIKGAHWHTNYAVELDKQQRLHIHGLFTRPTAVNVGSYKRTGYTIHFQEFDTYEHAKGYMNKQDQCKIAQDQRECESYYHYHYGFI